MPDQITLFFQEQENLWKNEAGYTIAECKIKEKKLLEALLLNNKHHYTTQGINQAISWLRQNGEMKAANKLEKEICDVIR